MGEAFRVAPAQLAGVGNFVGQSVDDYQRVMTLLGEGGTTEDFGGLMAALRGPVLTLNESTRTRWSDMGKSLGSISIGLRKSAWLFHDTDADNADAFNKHVRYVGRTCGPEETLATTELDPNDPSRKVDIDAYPGAAGVGQPTAIDVGSPPQNEPDIRGLIRSTAGWLADIDETVERLAHWSPIRQAIKPISGNWEELRRIGQVYGKSGTAIGTIGNDVATKTGALDATWDGKAAQAFFAYSRSTTQYIEWEAALGRMLREGFDRAATEFQNAVGAALRVTIEEFEKVISIKGKTGPVKWLAKALPGVGTAAQLADLGRALVTIGREVLPLIQRVEQAVNDFKAFIEFAQDPVGYLQKKGKAEIDARLQPYSDRLKEFRRKTQIAKDVVTLMTTSGLTGRETNSYSPNLSSDAWEGVP
ncbi:hypothetical protein GCM10009624_20000 [Gordonia sinesedis]